MNVGGAWQGVQSEKKNLPNVLQVSLSCLKSADQLFFSAGRWTVWTELCSATLSSWTCLAGVLQRPPQHAALLHLCVSLFSGYLLHLFLQTPPPSGHLRPLCEDVGDAGGNSMIHRSLLAELMCFLSYISLQPLWGACCSYLLIAM